MYAMAKHYPELTYEFFFFVRQQEIQEVQHVTGNQTKFIVCAATKGERMVVLITSNKPQEPILDQYI